MIVKLGFILCQDAINLDLQGEIEGEVEGEIEDEMEDEIEIEGDMEPYLKLYLDCPELVKEILGHPLGPSAQARYIDRLLHPIAIGAHRDIVEEVVLAHVVLPIGKDQGSHRGRG